MLCLINTCSKANHQRGQQYVYFHDGEKITLPPYISKKYQYMEQVISSQLLTAMCVYYVRSIIIIVLVCGFYNR